MLEVTRLRAGYGAINVLWDVDVRVAKGRLTTIIGPNGAGKTTLLRAIMGLIPVGGGEIRIDGQSRAGTSTWDMARLGVAMIPEGRMIFGDMSVEENLLMGAFHKSHRAQAQTNLAHMYELFPQLKERRNQLAGSLSGGESQMLAIGRGLMAEPRMILVDEPSLGLAPVLVQEIFATLAGLKAEGRTILLVEQNTHMAVGIADHVYILQAGKVVLSESASNVELQQIHSVYFAR
ncbi:MAG: ABC transporter ATP-binding protein [Betaproteobacteria bacterium]|nr:MAG: ABC transporter ATP-binding protein [Betaproteobacteria bacterium]